MKKIFYLLIAFNVFFAKNVFSQTDNNGFSFQGYAVDADGKAIGSTPVSVRFTIYVQGTSSTGGYQETDYLTTDAFGVFTATIGSQSPTTFAQINFAAKIYNLKVEVEKTTGGTWVSISDGQLLSVPYARAASNGVPVGSIIPFGGPISSIPAGWLPCDGTQYDGTNYKYAQLYAIIQNNWGGSGTTFNVPDLRGYFLRGVDSEKGNDPDRASRTSVTSGGSAGDNVGSYQTDVFASHNHTGTTSIDGAHVHDNNITGQKDVQVYTDGNGTTTGSDYSVGEINTISYHPLVSAGAHSHTLNINNTGGSETRPKNAYVWFIIKY